MAEPRRIFIVGSSGAGKSTLGAELGRRLGLPVTHVDKLVWRAGWVMAHRDQLERDVGAVLAREAWILDSALRRDWDRAVKAADLVLFLDYPAWLCLGRVLKRIAQSWRQVRPDMADGCPEQVDWEFFRWIWRWPKTHRPYLMETLEMARRVERFRRPRELEAWLRSLP